MSFTPLTDAQIQAYARDYLGAVVTYKARVPGDEGPPKRFAGQLTEHEGELCILRASRFDLHGAEKAPKGSDNWERLSAWEVGGLELAHEYATRSMREASVEIHTQADATHRAQVDVLKKEIDDLKKKKKKEESEPPSWARALLEVEELKKRAARPSPAPAPIAQPQAQPQDPHWAEFVRSNAEAANASKETAKALAEWVALLRREKGVDEEGTVPPRLFAVNSWGTFFAEGDTKSLKLQLQQRYEMIAESSAAKENAFAALASWIDAAAPAQVAPSGDNLILGRRLLRALRDVISKERGVDVDKVHATLAKSGDRDIFGKDAPQDWYAQAVSAHPAVKLPTVAKLSGRNTSGMTCWYCSKGGHSAHDCRTRIADGAPVPRTAPTHLNERRGRASVATESH